MEADEDYSRSRRLLVSLFCLLNSSVGLVATAFIVAAYLERDGRPPGGWLPAAILFAWSAYAVMNWGWIRNRQVHRLWPILGSLVGAACVLPLLPFSLCVLPSIVLACYLAAFHLLDRPRRAGRLFRDD